MDDYIKKLLEKYLRGDLLTDAEIEIILELLYGNEESLEISTDEKLVFKDAIKSKIDNQLEEKTKSSSKQFWRIRSFVKYSQVAMLLVFLSSGLIYLIHTLDSKNRNEKTHIQSFSSSIVFESKDSIKTLLLEDGSIVSLNKNSVLKIEKGFGVHERKVLLDGEAYFDVSHNVAIPFIVLNKQSKIQVIGTTFWINNKKEIIQTTLLDGKITYQSGTNLLTLHPNEQVQEYATGEIVKSAVKDLEELNKWRPQVIPLHNIKLIDLLSYIESRYFITIEYENKAINNCVISTSILGTESYKQLLDEIAMVNNLSYTSHKNNVSLKGDGCPLVLDMNN